MSPLSKGWIYFCFKINQDYIAKNLCENRAKPKLNCKGKCQLKKQLKQAEKQEQKQLPETLKKSEVLYCFSLENFVFSKFTEILEAKKPFFENQLLLGSLLNFEIFHPPKFVLI
ncbi:MAG: hypothetical protein C4K58_06610 [Flavobacteriaceae bacterium]|nr:MAG: hypothetical protein C4K58_06610 [Flavobacteriaceae bacterium]